ncbi:MAG: phosphoribosyl-AMP cyclohydrolase [Gemmatimonadota bacterium]
MRLSTATELDTLDFAKHNGLIPAVVQDHSTGQVLMLGFADREALRRCLDSGDLWLYSRSRQEYWRKGATSGNTQRVIAIYGDCDRDAVLIRVEPAGPMCHTGEGRCFGVD